MRAVTLASLLCLSVVCTALVSAIFATTLAAGALASLPRSGPPGFVQMASNAPIGIEPHAAVTR